MGFKVDTKGSPSSWVNGGGAPEWPVGIGKSRECGRSTGPGVAGASASVLVVWPPGHDARNAGPLCHLPKSHHFLIVKLLPVPTSHCPHGGESHCSGGPWSGRAGRLARPQLGSPFLEDVPGGKQRFQ